MAFQRQYPCYKPGNFKCAVDNILILPKLDNGRFILHQFHRYSFLNGMWSNGNWGVAKGNMLTDITKSEIL